MLKIGSVIDNKYKILNIVGKGGMSLIYLAMNEKANKQWAIKEIQRKGFYDFAIDKQEIEMMKRLKHPGLPAIVDVIEQKDSLLIVMDYIEGRSLEDLVLEHGPQSELQVINYAKQICDILHYLHSQNPPIIYRDMKPANVMLRPDGKLCLIDFGAAREYKPGNRKDTVLLGTKGYAAPEQYRSKGQSDVRTDIYSLGVTLFRLLTGETPEGLCQIGKLRPDISAGLSHIVMKCLHMAKEERYQSVLELLDELNHYWEYDKKYQKEQKRKAWLFGLAFFASLSFGIGAAVFGVLAKNTMENSYAAYLQDGSYEKAICLDPSNEEAYLKLLENVFLEDGCLKVEESADLKKFLMENERTFRKNQEGYERFCYEVGIAYFYKYEDRNNKKYAVGYFEVAANSKALSEQKRSRAKRLAIISDYYSKIGVMDEAGDILVSYKEYWSDLCAAAEGNIVKEDNERTAIVMYEEMIGQMLTNAEQLKRSGVTKKEMIDCLVMLNNRVANDFQNSDEIVINMLQEDLTKLQENMKKAKRMIDSVYKETE